jgi:hypothetical protein
MISYRPPSCACHNPCSSGEPFDVRTAERTVHARVVYVALPSGFSDEYKVELGEIEQ